jgi:myosin heavy subunit
MILNDEKNKTNIEFIKIENKNLIENEKNFKNKISELLKKISEIKEENNKYLNISEKNDEMSNTIKKSEEKIEILENNLKELNKEKEQYKELLKEKNKRILDDENNNILLRKDLDIINEKLKEFINENDSIKKLNKDLFEEKNDLEKKYKNLNEENEKIRINLGNMENEQKLIIADNNNLKYLNLINEKKICVANCEIQEMDKTVKYLKKNLEQIKLTNSNYSLKNNKLFCCQCGCLVNNYDNRECEINKLIEDNKVLFKINRDLKNKLDKITMNLNSNKNNDDLN